MTELLSTRCERAGPEEQPDLLNELWWASGKRGTDAEVNDFHDLLPIRSDPAYLAAGMMLLAEGWTIYHLGGPFEGPVAHATIACTEPTIIFVEGTAATPALALCAAISRSLGL